jgi:hypothetical protein
MEDDMPPLVPIDEYHDMPHLISIDDVFQPVSSLSRNTPYKVVEEEITKLINMNSPIILEELVVRMFKMRNPRGGEGERKLFQWMFAVLYKYHPNLCVSLLPCIPAYGCWKDLFQLAMNHYSLFNPVINLSYHQLIADEAALKAGTPLSLFAKWMPKEGKSMARFTKYFANYLYGNGPMTHSERMGQLRRRISTLNKALKTVETLQCANRWDEINPAATPTLARKKMSAAFMNEKPGTNEIRSDNQARMICRDKFKAFNNNYVSKGVTYINTSYSALREYINYQYYLNTYVYV